MKTIHNKRWEAVVTCDDKYDNIFFYAVKTTGVFCRPSCKSKTPKRENVEFFLKVEQALLSGYRPCKRCRPDYHPIYDPSQEIIGEVKKILENEYKRHWTLQSLAQYVGISPYYLHRLFKEKTGITPKQYLNHIRIEEAKLLLLQGEKKNMDICFSVGFNDLNHFYTIFRKQTGYSPLKYRQLQSINNTIT